MHAMLAQRTAFPVPLRRFRRYDPESAAEIASTDCLTAAIRPADYRGVLGSAPALRASFGCFSSHRSLAPARASHPWEAGILASFCTHRIEPAGCDHSL